MADDKTAAELGGRFDDHGNAIVGNIAIPASHVDAFRALLTVRRVAPDREKEIARVLAPEQAERKRQRERARYRDRKAAGA